MFRGLRRKLESTTNALEKWFCQPDIVFPDTNDPIARVPATGQVARMSGSLPDRSS